MKLILELDLRDDTSETDIRGIKREVERSLKPYEDLNIGMGRVIVGSIQSHAWDESELS